MSELNIISRDEWGAAAPLWGPYPVDIMPTPELYLHHSAGSGSDEASVRGIQRYHQTPASAGGPATGPWSDIAYSFLIDNDPPDVDVFEGRGAGIAGGHTQGRNKVSHAICVIGNFTATPPKDDTLEAIAQLVAYGHVQGWWPDRITGGHRDAPGADTTCPGDALYARIPTINTRVQAILHPPVQEDTMYSLKRAHAATHGDGSRRSDIAHVAGKIREGFGYSDSELPRDGSWPTSMVNIIKAELGGNGTTITGNMGLLIERRFAGAVALGVGGGKLDTASFAAYLERVSLEFN